MHRLFVPLASMLLVLAAGPALAEWSYLPPGTGDQNVHRAFAFAEDSDDRLEFACNTERRDFFYSAPQSALEPDLGSLKDGNPTILIRLDGVGVLPLDADDAYQEGERVIFVTAVKSAFINDLGKERQPVAAGMQANGEIVRQSLFPVDRLETAMRGLAVGCGF